MAPSLQASPATGLTSAVAGPHDEAFLYELYASVRQDEVAAWGWPAAEQHAFIRAQYECQRQSYSLYYPHSVDKIVLWHDDRVGRILTARVADDIALVDLAILPAYRSRGLGTKLIHELQEVARTGGLGLRLHVLLGSPAQRLYTRLGFRENGDGRFPYIGMRWEPGFAKWGADNLPVAAAGIG